jgi:ribosome-binding factor A
MSRRRPKADEFESLAADRSPEDGGDPKDFHAKPWDAPKQAGRKARQLCAQVREALIAATAACGDPAVQAARIWVVTPAPHSGRMRVVIYSPPDIGRDAMVEALARAAGHLRSEVARVISRKFAPELVFEVIEVQ